MSHLSPKDLLSLTKTSRDLEAFLTVDAYSWIWLQARKFQEPELPPLPRGYREYEYANLVFDTHCHVCPTSVRHIQSDTLCYRNVNNLRRRLYCGRQRCGCVASASRMSQCAYYPSMSIQSMFVSDTMAYVEHPSRCRSGSTRFWKRSLVTSTQSMPPNLLV